VKHRTDENQPEIVKALHALGFSVHDTSGVGNGFPDLVVAMAGVNILVEVKRDAKALTTPAQDIFMAEWKGPYIVATDAAQVVDLYNRIVRGRK